MKEIVTLGLLVCIMAVILCCMNGFCKEIYVGPYDVVFNDSDHRVSMVSLETMYRVLPSDDIDKYFFYPQYEGVSWLNNSSTTIVITEGDLNDNQIANLTSLTPNKGFVQLRNFGRVIDGLDGFVAEYKNKSKGWIEQQAVFAFKAAAKQYDFTHTNIAVVNIYATNYTEPEFDRLLDTFKINRLIES